MDIMIIMVVITLNHCLVWSGGLTVDSCGLVFCVNNKRIPKPYCFYFLNKTSAVKISINVHNR